MLRATRTAAEIKKNEGWGFEVPCKKKDYHNGQQTGDINPKPPGTNHANDRLYTQQVRVLHQQFQHDRRRILEIVPRFLHVVLDWNVRTFSTGCIQIQRNIAW